jgi:hypothetical protein
MKYMRRSFTAVAALMVLSLTVLLCPSDPARAAPTMRVRILPSSGPHTVGTRTLVTFHLKVFGIKLDPAHVGKLRVAGHGHIQMYLDRIPKDATKVKDMTGVVAVVAATNFSIGFTRSWLRIHAGWHRLVVALARNDDTLYPVPPALFPVTVK